MPGVTNIWTQPIRNRIDMLSTGIRTQVGIKIFGSNLSTIEQLSSEIERTVHNVLGAVDLYAERITGAPYLEIKTDRAEAARYGISVGDVQDVIETAVGGKNLTTAIDGRQRLPISVRYARDFRETPEALRNVLVAAPNGAQIPLDQLASIQVVMGPSMISSENGLLRGSVLMNVRGRDVGSFVAEAQRAVARQVKLPAGYYIEWSGQYENQLSARRRLMLVIPAVFAIMSILLYKNLRLRKRGSARDACRALRPDRWHFSAETSGIQLLGCSVGGLHRAVRHGRSNGRGHGDLSRRGCGPQETSDGHTHSAGIARSRDGRRIATAASKGDDRFHGDRWFAAADVVSSNGSRGHETASHSGLRRHGVFAIARLDRDAGDLHLAARARDPTAIETCHLLSDDGQSEVIGHPPDQSR